MVKLGKCSKAPGWRGTALAVACVLAVVLQFGAGAQTRSVRVSAKDEDFSGGTQFTPYQGKNSHTAYPGDVVQATVNVDWDLLAPASLHLMGLAEAPAEIRIALNGTVLLEGANPWGQLLGTGASNWQEVMFDLPDGLLQQGANTLQIENYGSANWFMVSHAIVEGPGDDRSYSIPGDRLSGGDGHLVGYAYNGEAMNLAYGTADFGDRPLSAELRVDWENPGPLFLKLRGMADPGALSPVMWVELNGVTVFQEVFPFGPDWSDITISIPESVTQSGWNTLTIHNVSDGPWANPPWLMVSSVTLSEVFEEGTGVLVPDLVGLREGEARAVLSAAGLRVSVVTTPADGNPVGIVYNQLPAADTELAYGATVELFVPRADTPHTMPAAGLAGLLLCGLAAVAVGCRGLTRRA